MVETINKVIWTTEDLELLPHSEGTNYEIIEGDLFMTRSPHRKHQQVSLKIALQLENWSKETGLGETIIAPLQFNFDRQLTVFSPRRRTLSLAAYRFQSPAIMTKLTCSLLDLRSLSQTSRSLSS